MKRTLIILMTSSACALAQDYDYIHAYDHIFYEAAQRQHEQQVEQYQRQIEEQIHHQNIQLNEIQRQQEQLQLQLQFDR